MAQSLTAAALTARIGQLQDLATRSAELHAAVAEAGAHALAKAVEAAEAADYAVLAAVSTEVPDAGAPPLGLLLVQHEAALAGLAPPAVQDLVSALLDLVAHRNPDIAAAAMDLCASLCAAADDDGPHRTVAAALLDAQLVSEAAAALGPHLPSEDPALAAPEWTTDSARLVAASAGLFEAALVAFPAPAVGLSCVHLLARAVVAASPAALVDDAAADAADAALGAGAAILLGAGDLGTVAEPPVLEATYAACVGAVLALLEPLLALTPDGPVPGDAEYLATAAQFAAAVGTALPAALSATVAPAAAVLVAVARGDAVAAGAPGPVRHAVRKGAAAALKTLAALCRYGGPEMAAAAVDAGVLGLLGPVMDRLGRSKRQRDDSAATLSDAATATLLDSAILLAALLTTASAEHRQRVVAKVSAVAAPDTAPRGERFAALCRAQAVAAASAGGDDDSDDGAAAVELSDAAAALTAALRAL